MISCIGIPSSNVRRSELLFNLSFCFEEVKILSKHVDVPHKTLNSLEIRGVWKIKLIGYLTSKTWQTDQADDQDPRGHKSAFT